jgi:hypothetical protein
VPTACVGCPDAAAYTHRTRHLKRNTVVSIPSIVELLQSYSQAIEPLSCWTQLMWMNIKLEEVTVGLVLKITP